jgi:PAS domain S-box-containing protein
MNATAAGEAVLVTTTKPRAWIPVLAFFAALLAIAATGFLLFQHRAKELERIAHDELGAIADLKAEQIFRWTEDQRKNAEAIGRDNLLADEVERWFRQGASDGVVAQKIRARLEGLRQLKGYESIVLLDDKAHQRLRVGVGTELDSHDADLALQAIRENVVTPLDLQVSNDEKRHFDIVAPLSVSGTTGPRVFGAFYFHLDPNDFFAPYIQSWPTNSPSGETILARREGNEVHFLSTHRRDTGSRLTRRLPIDQPLLPAAIALREHLGVTDGVDYRGVPVIAVARAVPGTPWILVAKRDRAEIDAPLRDTWTIGGGLIALFMVLAVSVAGLWWRKQNAQQLAVTLEGRLERLALEQHLDYSTKFARDNILLADETGRLLECNNAALATYGYTRDELLHLTVADLRTPEAAATLPHDLEMAARPDGVTFETVHRRKDGGTFPVEVSTRLIDIEGQRFYQGIIRDITARNRAERELVESEARFRGLVDQSLAGIYIIQDGRFVYVNPRLAQILGYDSCEELIGRDALLAVVEEDRDMVAETMSRRIQGDSSAESHLNFHAIRKDGSVVDVGVHGAPANHAGRPAIVGLMQDISEKKRADEEIQRYIEQLKTAFMSTVEVATIISEMRDPYTAGHERRVAEIAVAIGAELGFDARQLEGLQVGGHLHDIGKIIVPAEILSKPGKLSPVEYMLIQGHVQAGYDVLKGVEFPWPVAQIALQHHERMDGSGYPQGLKGEAILFEARVMAVADVVEAISSHRPYRPGLGIDKALAEIERGRGKAYDGDAVDACLRLFRERGYQLPA